MKNNATARIVLDHKVKEASKPLKLRIIYQRIYRQYSIGDDSIRLTEEQFNNRRLKKTMEAMDVADKALRIAKNVIEELGTNFTFDAFKNRYRRHLTGRSSVSSSFDSLLSEYFSEYECKYKTRKSYETSINWVSRYKKTATLSTITPEFVDNLTSFMKNEHVKEYGNEMAENTLRIYLRQLRAIYNFAINKGYTNKKNPFAIKNLGSIRRQKAALSTEELKRLLEYTPKDKEEEIGKDFFILSLHCSGANLGDILLLKNSNIENDTVTFIRRKTQKTNIEIQFKLTDVAKTLFNKYGLINEAEPNSLILPYLANSKSESNLENRIKRLNRKINAGLKSISDALGLRKITTYNARHTYATLLMLDGMTAEQIQKFLGHSSSTTTQTYLGSLSTSILDANKSILDNLGNIK